MKQFTFLSIFTPPSTIPENVILTSPDLERKKNEGIDWYRQLTDIDNLTISGRTKFRYFFKNPGEPFSSQSMSPFP